LEEAEIIVPGRAKTEPEPELNARGQPTNPGEQRKTIELGLANLDVGWLNSRSGHVGREMEAELWARAKLFFEELLEEDEKEKSGAGNDGAVGP